MNYYENLATMPNTIRERITEYAQEQLDRTLVEGYEPTMECLGGEVHHLCFSEPETQPDGRVWPRNEAEWVEVRDDLFEALLKDHCADRLSVQFYENPVDGMAVAVDATLCDLVAFRAVELNGGVDTEYAPPSVRA